MGGHRSTLRQYAAAPAAKFVRLLLPLQKLSAIRPLLPGALKVLLDHAHDAPVALPGAQLLVVAFCVEKVEERRVRERLQHRIHVARVSEVLQPRTKFDAPGVDSTASTTTAAAATIADTAVSAAAAAAAATAAARATSTTTTTAAAATATTTRAISSG